MDNADKPAFPVPEYRRSNGLTKYEKTCIELGVPETGDERIDEIIRKAERRDIAKAAMQGMLSNPKIHEDMDRIFEKGNDPVKDLTESSMVFADALLNELED